MSTAPRNQAAKKDWGHDTSGCTILHIDMDAFFASCEMKRHPELLHQPVIIGTGNRSVVSAANYKAREFGVNSAMPVAQARRLCPKGIFLPADMNYYREISHRVFSIFYEVTNHIEPVSVDECYMDVSSALLQWDNSPIKIAQWIRHTVHERLGLTCSVGIATNKLIAKIASTNAKPNGMLLIPRNRHCDFIQMMNIRSIPGVGSATEKSLKNYGISTVRQLADLRESDIIRIVGSRLIGHSLFLAAQGRDDRTVISNTSEKSIGYERTLRTDTQDARTVCNLLRICCDKTASHLRERQLATRTITVKLRFANMTYASKTYSFPVPTQSAAILSEHSRRLLSLMVHIDPSTQTMDQVIRLAGISTSHFSDTRTTLIQQSFDDVWDAQTDEALSQDYLRKKRLSKTEKALDDIRHKFGENSVNFGF